MTSFEDLLACPRCGEGALTQLRCAACGEQYSAPGGIPDLRIPSDARTESEFARRLDESIPGDALVLELGCGTGQLSLFLASADRTVVGADLARPSLELARDAAVRYGLSDGYFVGTDLRAAGPSTQAFRRVLC